MAFPTSSAQIFIQSNPSCKIDAIWPRRLSFFQ